MAKKQILVCCVLLAACGEPKPTASLGTTDAAPPAMDAQRQNDGTPVPMMDASTSDGTVPTGDMSSPTALDMGNGRDLGVPVTDTGSPINDGQPPPLDQGPTDAQQPDVTFVDAHPFDAAPPPMRVEGMPCPQAWGSRPLEPDEEGGWSVRGTTEGAQSRGEGSCGGNSGQHIYTFTAPDDGSYAVQVTGDTFAQLGFAVVYVRTGCADPDTELACDARREPNAAVTLNLPAQQTVYIFVDGIRSGQFPTTGGYRLQVFRRQIPVLTSANAWVNPVTASTSIDLAGTLGNLALGGVQYRFRDANGQVVPSRGRVDPLRFGLVFETMEQPDG